MCSTYISIICRILEHFKTTIDEFSIIFTSGATAALKIVAETFQYGDNGYLAYLQDNHTSVLGMRAYAENIRAVHHEEILQALLDTTDHRTEKSQCENNSLFVFPAQSNFSGTKYPLSIINAVYKGAMRKIIGKSSGNWFCMLDAAAFVATSELDLSKIKPDFVCISFYKIFGYPSGLGALLVKNKSAEILKKKYYGGGTVQMALSLENIVIQRQELHER